MIYQENTKEDEVILKEASKRFKYLMDLEADNRMRWLEDVKFANGDPDNGWQWDSSIEERLQNGKPALTENIIKAHNRAIVNEYRMNKTSPKVSPEGKDGNREAANILNGIIKKIEKQSGADEAYTLAEEFAVDGGLGYYRITTDYVEDSFDQEIFIKKVRNPLNILLDISGESFRDVRYGFVVEEVLEEDFKSKYPNSIIGSFKDSNSFGYVKEGLLKLVEYFRVVDTKDIMYQTEDGTILLKSELDGMDVSGLKSRPVTVPVVEWYLLGNNSILERGIWAGKYIPIIKVVGTELVIGDELYRSGHTRALKDAQRMHNYWTSSAIEYVSLAGKQPYLVDARSIEGHEGYWNTMDSENYPYLPYNATDSLGNPLPVPSRQEPPILPDAYIKGLQISNQAIQDISGQYQQQMGQAPSDQSGVAIRNLQVKGDIATYHFFDNANTAKLAAAEMLIDLVPKIYDTYRMIKIVGEDGEEAEIVIDPTAKLPVSEKVISPDEVKQIFNPRLGKYSVSPTTGASYATKRQEQSEALLSLGQIHPEIWGVAGDLIVKSQDWVMGDEIAERVKRSMSPNITGEQQQIPPEVQQQLIDMQASLQQKDQLINQMDGAIQQMQTLLITKNDEIQIKAEKLNIDRYNAETNRLKVME